MTRWEDATPADTDRPLVADIITLADMADRLGLAGASSLRHQIRNGRLTGIKVGTTWVVSMAEFERYRATVSKVGALAAIRALPEGGPEVIPTTLDQDVR